MHFVELNPFLTRYTGRSITANARSPSANTASNQNTKRISPTTDLTEITPTRLTLAPALSSTPQTPMGANHNGPEHLHAVGVILPQSSPAHPYDQSWVRMR